MIDYDDVCHAIYKNNKHVIITLRNVTDENVNEVVENIKKAYDTYFGRSIIVTGRRKDMMYYYTTSYTKIYLGTRIHVVDTNTKFIHTFLGKQHNPQIVVRIVND
jgi:ABC-type lipopolysaccharide export system ATPase subunit